MSRQQLYCYGCGAKATTMIHDIETGTRKPLLTMLLCNKCNIRRKQLESSIEWPENLSAEDDAFMRKITHGGQAS